jgi:uncharacterized membrane protein YqjE
MSTTITAAAVSIIATVLPLFGIEFDSEKLTELVQAVVLIGSALWVWRERYLHGGVTILGARTNRG